MNYTAEDLKKPALQKQVISKLKSRTDPASFLDRLLSVPLAVGSVPDVIHSKDPVKYLTNIAKGFDTAITGRKHERLKTTSDLLKQANLLQNKDPITNAVNVAVSFAGDLALDPSMYVSAPKALMKKDAIQLVEKMGMNVADSADVVNKLVSRGVEPTSEWLLKTAGKDKAATKAGKVMKQMSERLGLKESRKIVSDIGEKAIINNEVAANIVDSLLNPLGVVGRGAKLGFKTVAPGAYDRIGKKFNELFRLGRNAEDNGLKNASLEMTARHEVDPELQAALRMNQLLSDGRLNKKEYEYQMRLIEDNILNAAVKDAKKNGYKVPTKQDIKDYLDVAIKSEKGGLHNFVIKDDPTNPFAQKSSESSENAFQDQYIKSPEEIIKNLDEVRGDVPISELSDDVIQSTLDTKLSMDELDAIRGVSDEKGLAEVMDKINRNGATGSTGQQIEYISDSYRNVLPPSEAAFIKHEWINALSNPGTDREAAAKILASVKYKKAFGKKTFKGLRGPKDSKGITRGGIIDDIRDELYGSGTFGTNIKMADDEALSAVSSRVLDMLQHQEVLKNNKLFNSNPTAYIYMEIMPNIKREFFASLSNLKPAEYQQLSKLKKVAARLQEAEDELAKIEKRPPVEFGPQNVTFEQLNTVYPATETSKELKYKVSKYDYDVGINAAYKSGALPTSAGAPTLESTIGEYDESIKAGDPELLNTKSNTINEEANQVTGSMLEPAPDTHLLDLAASMDRQELVAKLKKGGASDDAVKTLLEHIDTSGTPIKPKLPEKTDKEILAELMKRKDSPEGRALNLSEAKEAGLFVKPKRKVSKVVRDQKELRDIKKWREVKDSPEKLAHIEEVKKNNLARIGENATDLEKIDNELAKKAEAVKMPKGKIYKKVPYDAPENKIVNLSDEVLQTEKKIGEEITNKEYKMPFKSTKELIDIYKEQKVNLKYDDKMSYEDNIERMYSSTLALEHIRQTKSIEDVVLDLHSDGYRKLYSEKPIEGWVKITGDSSLAGKYIPQAAADMFDEYYKAFNPKDFQNGTLNKFMLFFDKLQNGWKKIVTSYSPWTPAYGVRNAIGDFINVTLGGFGGGNPIRMYRSFMSGLDMMKFIKVAEESGLSKATKEFGKEMAAKYQYIRKYSITSGKFSQIADASLLYEKAGKYYKKPDGWWKKHVIGSLEWRENFQRVSNFIDKLDQGGAPAVAARDAKKSSLDFAKMTEFERKYMKRALPFYGFMKTNLEHQLDVFSKSHKPLLIQQKIIENLKHLGAGQDISEEEWDNMPEWLKDGYVLPISKDDKGNVKLIAGFGEPTQAINDILNLNNPLDALLTLASGANPLVKYPLELATNYSLFKKDKISNQMRGSYWKDFPLPLRKALGWKSGDTIREKDGTTVKANTVDPFLSYALQTMPFVSPFITQAKNVLSAKTDPVSAILNTTGILGGKIRLRNTFGDQKIAERQTAADVEDILSNLYQE